MLGAAAVLLAVALVSAPDPAAAVQRPAARGKAAAVRAPRGPDPRSLAARLVASAATDEAKARALYDWIAANITYDSEALSSGCAGAGTAEEVLRRRRALCGGYSELFRVMARSVGLRAVCLRGYARGAGYRVGLSETLEPHAWNAVQVEGVWRLLDVTWGAGETDRASVFRDFWFLTPPAQFAATHYPQDPRWQLLPTPLAKAQFEALPLRHPNYYRSGLEVVSPRQGTVRTGLRLPLTLKVPSDAWLAIDVTQEGRSVPARSLQGLTADGRYQAQVEFPGAGEYELTLHVGPKGRPAVSAVTYRALVSDDTAALETLYLPRDAWDGVVLESPVPLTFEAGRTYLVTGRTLRPDARQVQLGLQSGNGRPVRWLAAPVSQGRFAIPLEFAADEAGDWGAAVTLDSAAAQALDILVTAPRPVVQASVEPSRDAAQGS